MAYRAASRTELATEEEVTFLWQKDLKLKVGEMEGGNLR